MGVISPDSCNGLALIQVYFYRLTFKPLDRKSSLKEGEKAAKEDGHETVFHKYIHGMRTAPLREAYVMLFWTSECGMPVEEVQASSAMFCRTTREGELLMVDEAMLASGVPVATDENRVAVPAGETFDYYWTLNYDRFKTVIEDVRNDFQYARRVHDFFSFRASWAGAEGENPFELLHAEDEDYWAEDIYPIFRQTMLADPAKIPGFDRSRSREWDKPARGYVLAQRRAADTIYRGELIHYHALGLLQRSAKEFAVFDYVEGICENAQHRRRIRVECSENSMADPGYALEEKYLDYACQAGCEGVDGWTFETAMGLRSQDDWVIDGARRKISPYLPYGENFFGEKEKLPPKNVQAYVRYYEYYRFGADKDVKEKIETVKRYKKNRVHERLTAIRGQIQSLIASIPYYELFLCLGNYPQNEPDEDLHLRYLDLSVDVRHKWWETFDPYDDYEWNRVQRYKDAIGKAMEKIFDTYPEHFEIYENIQKYGEMLATEKSTVKMLHALQRWNARHGNLKGPLRDSDFHITAHPQKWIITLNQQGQKEIEVRYLIRSGSKWRLLDRKGPTAPEKFDKVRMPFPEFKALPKFLNVFGLALGTSVSICELAEKIKEENGIEDEAIGVARVTKDVFQLVTGSSEFLHGLLPHASHHGAVAHFAEYGEALAKPGFVLEILLNFYDSGKLFLSEEGSLATSPDTFTAALQSFKGAALFASGVYGSYDMIAAAIAGAIPAVGLPLALGGLAVVFGNLMIDAYHDSSDSTKPIRDALEEALKKEFKDGNDRTANSLNAFSEELKKFIAMQHRDSVWQCTLPPSRATTSN